MNRSRGIVLGLWLVMSAAQAVAEEPIEGLWQMISQHIGKNNIPPAPLALRVTAVSGGFRFDYLLHRELTLERTFTVRTDGTPGVITDIKGSTLGVAKLVKNSPTDYKLVLQTPNGRPEAGKLTITDKGFILRCETEANVPGQGPSRVVQVFAKQTVEP